LERTRNARLHHSSQVATDKGEEIPREKEEKNSDRASENPSGPDGSGHHYALVASGGDKDDGGRKGGAVAVHRKGTWIWIAARSAPVAGGRDYGARLSPTPWNRPPPLDHEEAAAQHEAFVAAIGWSRPCLCLAPLPARRLRLLTPTLPLLASPSSMARRNTTPAGPSAIALCRVLVPAPRHGRWWSSQGL
jgi:hypothetical protein